MSDPDNGGEDYWSDTKAAKAAAVITATIGMFISLYGIKKHAEYYNAPRTQKYIFRIIFVVPVFSGMAFWLFYCYIASL